jgi:hypothetical protein
MPILGVVASSINVNLDSNVMFPIAYNQLTTTATSFTISSIPATYSHLRIYTSVKTSRSAFIDPLLLRFNGDSGSNYSYSLTEGEAPTTFAGASAQSQTSAYWGRGAGASNGLLRGVGVIDIYNYANTNIKKTFNSVGGIDYGSGGNIVASIGAWESTAAISSITIIPAVGPNLVAGTVFQIFGIK